MKTVGSGEIKEFVLNSTYLTDEDFETLVNTGVPVRWMEEDEGNDKDIFVLEIE